MVFYWRFILAVDADTDYGDDDDCYEGNALSF